MPLTHIRTFRVRYYECDANRLARPASFLRYMQEAAFDASAAAGYDLAHYAEMKRIWLVRETDIQYTSPLRYGDWVQVKTWVSDFRRVRSRRAYELSLVSSGTAVAHARTDWVFLDSASGFPASIPAEMMAAFFPEGPPAVTSPRSRLPAPPPQPSGVFRTIRRAEWQDLDQAQHVNNAVYLGYLEDCQMQAAAACGWTAARMQTEGLAIRPTRVQIEYRQPAFLHDELELTTWIARMEGDTALSQAAIVRLSDGLPVVHARLSWTCVHPVTGEPIGIPHALLAALAPDLAVDT